MSSKNITRYAIMRSKINKCLNDDTVITVTFKTKAPRKLHSITKSGKPIYQLDSSNRSITLSDEFISSCVEEAKTNKKKDAIDVILSYMFDMRHDFKADYFMINT